MKVFVHYAPRNIADAFEGTRLRKTIKGACEAVSIPWVDVSGPDVTIAHFISPDDIALLREHKEAGVLTVVSAFYTEDDPHAHFFAPSKTPRLTKKALALLNEADLVLVPDPRVAELAKYLGVTSKIEVIPPAVRRNRFSKNTPEAQAFPRYFRLRPEQKVVVAKGSYFDTRLLHLLRQVASECPDLEFYFFGTCGRYDVLNLAKHFHRLGASKNLHLRDMVQDDIYRSALLRSMAYISGDDLRPDPLGPIEAFASKTQVVALQSNYLNPLLVDGKTAKYFATAHDMAEYLNALNLGTAESTIDSAFALTKDHNLIAFGKRLKQLYEALASGESR